MALSRPAPKVETVERVSRDMHEVGYTAVFLLRGFRTEAAAREFLRELSDDFIEERLNGWYYDEGRFLPHEAG